MSCTEQQLPADNDPLSVISNEQTEEFSWKVVLNVIVSQAKRARQPSTALGLGAELTLKTRSAELTMFRPNSFSLSYFSPSTSPLSRSAFISFLSLSHFLRSRFFFILVFLLVVLLAQQLLRLPFLLRSSPTAHPRDDKRESRIGRHVSSFKLFSFFSINIAGMRRIGHANLTLSHRDMNRANVLTWGLGLKYLFSQGKYPKNTFNTLHQIYFAQLPYRRENLDLERGTCRS